MSDRTLVPNSATDTDLLTAFARSGDEAAFSAIVGRYAGLVRATAQRTAGEADAEEEVAQHVFALLARKAGRGVRAADHLAGWLHRTTVYTALRHRRARTRHRRKLTAFAAQALPSSTAEPLPSPAWEAALPVLDACLRHLREPERRVLIMRYFEGLTYAGIGAATGKSAEAAKKQTARALERLRLLMHRRGALLTAVALTGMMASQASSHTTAAASGLAPAALKAAPALTWKTLLLHSFHFMNTTKIAAAAVLVVLCSVPVVRQENALAALRREVADLELRTTNAARASSALPAVAKAAPADPPAVPVAAASLDIEQIARDLELLRAAGPKIRPDSLTPDRRAAFDRIASLQASGFDRLLGDAGRLSGGAARQTKIRRALFDELSGRPVDVAGSLVLLHHAAAVTRGMDHDALFQIHQHAEKWLACLLANDPDTAAQEYAALQRSGGIEGKGTGSDAQVVYGQFVGRLHAVRPALAREFYGELALGGHLNALTGFVESRDPADRAFVLAEAAKLEPRWQSATCQMMLAVELAHAGLAGAAALFQSLHLPPDQAVDVAAGFVSETNSARAQAALTVPQRLAWLKEQPPEQFAAAGARFLSTSIEVATGEGDSGRMQALRDFDWGPQRDEAIAAFFKRGKPPADAAGALTLAVEISGAALRMETLQRLRRRFQGAPDDYQNAVLASPALSAAEKTEVLRP